MLEELHCLSNLNGQLILSAVTRTSAKIATREKLLRRVQWSVANTSTTIPFFVLLHFYCSWGYFHLQQTWFMLPYPWNNRPYVGLWESSVPFILLSNIHHILRKHLQSPNKNEVFIFGSAESVKEIFNLDGIALTSSITVRKLSTRTSTLTQHRLLLSCNIVRSCL